jgi:hypothetical protein
MTDVERLLERQARWQQAQRALSWSEKIRLAERMRPTLEAFRRLREQGPHGRPSPPTDADTSHT